MLAQAKSTYTLVSMVMARIIQYFAAVYRAGKSDVCYYGFVVRMVTKCILQVAYFSLLLRRLVVWLAVKPCKKELRRHGFDKLQNILSYVQVTLVTYFYESFWYVASAPSRLISDALSFRENVYKLRLSFIMQSIQASQH